MSDHKIDLSAFVNFEADSTDQTSKVWFAEGLQQATDRILIAFAPSDESTTPRSGDKPYPLTTRAIGQIREATAKATLAWQPWPNSWKGCIYCESIGATLYLVTQCKACDGSGFHYCDRCEDRHDCSKCSGDGSNYRRVKDPLTFCRPVDRSFRVAFCEADDCSIELGGGSFSRWYFRRIEANLVHPLLWCIGSVSRQNALIVRDSRGVTVCLMPRVEI